jgi:hypothetical protein
MENAPLTPGSASVVPHAQQQQQQPGAGRSHPTATAAAVCERCARRGVQRASQPGHAWGGGGTHARTRQRTVSTTASKIDYQKIDYHGSAQAARRGAAVRPARTEEQRRQVCVAVGAEQRLAVLQPEQPQARQHLLTRRARDV